MLFMVFETRERVKLKGAKANEWYHKCMLCVFSRERAEEILTVQRIREPRACHVYKWKQKSNCMKFIYLANNIQLGFRKFKSKFNFKFIFFSTGEKWEHSTRISCIRMQTHEMLLLVHCCAHVCECVYFFASFNTKRNFALISFRPLATLQPKMENEKKQTNELYDHLHYEWPNKTRAFFVCTLSMLCDALYATIAPALHTIHTSYLFGVSI